MIQSIFWDSYLAADVQSANLKQRLCACEAAFADHKSNIAKLIQQQNPTSVAILGAGYLNDIPLDDLVHGDRKVYLVDWIDDVSKVGVSNKILCTTDEGNTSCLFCSEKDPKSFCTNYTGELLSDGLCTGYEPLSQPLDTCKNYEPGTNPRFLKADITGGVAVNFSKDMEKAIRNCKTAKQAFKKAIHIAENARFSAMDIESDSIDLVTSSMIISQFDAEPYNYFATLLEQQFDTAEIQKHQKTLIPLMEQLRTKLFTQQVESHVKEIYRILKKNGQAKAYLSAELFRSCSDQQFFLVQDMPKALEIIGQYFFFELGDQLETETLSKSNLGNGTSVNQCYVLSPKDAKYL
ncbi:MAG: hypothetical protein COA78_32200 [Blastopirellula sp.]|nr:MAG: hypothetical protein COA78_32200 [Blastopirellula sp.]